MSIFLTYSQRENAAALVAEKLGVTISVARERITFEGGNQCIYHETAASKYLVDLADKTVTRKEH